MVIRDDSPKLPDGSEFDGTNLLQLLRSSQSPFEREWDVNLLIEEVEDKPQAQVIDIPFANMGSNHYVRICSGMMLQPR